MNEKEVAQACTDAGFDQAKLTQFLVDANNSAQIASFDVKISNLRTKQQEQDAPIQNEIQSLLVQKAAYIDKLKG